MNWEIYEKGKWVKIEKSEYYISSGIDIAITEMNRAKEFEDSDYYFIPIPFEVDRPTFTL